MLINILRILYSDVCHLFECKSYLAAKFAIPKAPLYSTALVQYRRNTNKCRFCTLFLACFGLLSVCGEYKGGLLGNKYGYDQIEMGADRLAMGNVSVLPPTFAVRRRRRPHTPTHNPFRTRPQCTICPMVLWPGEGRRGTAIGCTRLYPRHENKAFYCSLGPHWVQLQLFCTLLNKLIAPTVQSAFFYPSGIIFCVCSTFTVLSLPPEKVCQLAQ